MLRRRGYIKDIILRSVKLLDVRHSFDYFDSFERSEGLGFYRLPFDSAW